MAECFDRDRPDRLLARSDHAARAQRPRRLTRVIDGDLTVVAPQRREMGCDSAIGCNIALEDFEICRIKLNCVDVGIWSPLRKADRGKPDVRTSIDDVCRGLAEFEPKFIVDENLSQHT